MDKKDKRKIKEIEVLYDHKLSKAIEAKDRAAVIYMLETGEHYVTNFLEIITGLVIAENVEFLDLVLVARERGISTPKYYADLWAHVSIAYRVAEKHAKSYVITYLSRRFDRWDDSVRIIGDPAPGNINSHKCQQHVDSSFELKSQTSEEAIESMRTAFNKYKEDRGRIMNAAHAICDKIPPSLRESYPKDETEAALLFTADHLI